MRASRTMIGGLLLGDNREYSDDSRHWGPIRSAQFVGRLTRLVKR